MNRPGDELGAVVGGNDAHAFGQGWLQLLDFLLDPLSDGEGILAVAHEDDAAHHFVAVFFVNPAAKLGAELDDRHVLDINRRAARFLDEGVLDVFLVANPAHAADQVLGVVFLDDAAAHRQVAFGHGGVEVPQGDAISAQGFRAHVDLEFLGKAAEGSDIGNTGGGVKHGNNVELVQGPQAVQVHGVRGARLHGVIINLPQGGRVGSQVGHDP